MKKQFGVKTVVIDLALLVAGFGSGYATKVALDHFNLPKAAASTSAPAFNQSKYFGNMAFDQNGYMNLTPDSKFHAEDPNNIPYDLKTIYGLSLSVKDKRWKVINHEANFQAEANPKSGESLYPLPWIEYRLCTSEVKPNELQEKERIPTLPELEKLLYVE